MAATRALVLCGGESEPAAWKLGGAARRGRCDHRRPMDWCATHEHSFRSWSCYLFDGLIFLNELLGWSLVKVW
ncbi:hypothetical protein E2562_036739 [Oryza meyeriana var. granulata]|uniref:Uncharacterized protein n=1 Tax=Oryza meyeriana var. granulata TaxID=110450 RepID=A0A6G1DV61_9ORYZ|nr:hypothetical protein E2562_036739 [Oryza meyeriana var. granulata]